VCIELFANVISVCAC